MGSGVSEVKEDQRKLRRKPDPGSGRLAFGPFVLDPELGSLTRGTSPIPLAPKPFETLLYLARSRGRLVPKAELLEKVWSGTFVTEDVLVHSVVEIRRATGDTAKDSLYIRTVPRKGYQFVAPVRELNGAAPPAVGGAPGSGEPRHTPWTLLRSWRWPIVLMALLAVVGAWRVWAPRAPTTDRIETRPGALLVTPVRVEGPEGGDWLRQGIAEIMRSQLAQRPGVHVVARHRLAAALIGAGLDEDSGPEPSKALELAAQLGAERLVTASFIQIQDRFVLNAQLVHVLSRRSEGQIGVRGAYPDELLDGVDELCSKILDLWDVNDAPRPGAASWRPVRRATRSVDAFRHYSEALTWFARGGVRGATEAEKRLDEAVRLDPEFAYAHLKKAQILQWRRRYGYGDADPVPAIREALSLSEKLPERERRLVHMLASEFERHDSEAAIEEFRTLVSRYPSFAEEVGAPAIMADVYFRQGRWDALIGLGEAHAEGVSMPTPDRALLDAFVAQAFHQKGEFTRALASAEQSMRLWPTQDGPGFLRRKTERARILLDMGRGREALQEFQAVAGDLNADAVNLTAAAWGLYMAGEQDDARALVERALDLDPEFGNAYHLRGWLSLADGANAAAAADLEMAFRHTRSTLFGEAHHGFVGVDSGDLAALYYAGVAHQRLGHRAEAASALRRVIETCQRVRAAGQVARGSLPEWEATYLEAIAAARLGESRPELPLLRGDDATFFLQSARLHAVRGDRGRALRELTQALGIAPGERQHILDDPNFESLREDADFERILGVGPSS
jgi:DNA-binding winged helix-turn-helix (wHTH) protein/tetratricopeptide (TPR) repeat protein